MEKEESPENKVITDRLMTYLFESLFMTSLEDARLTLELGIQVNRSIEVCLNTYHHRTLTVGSNVPLICQYPMTIDIFSIAANVVSEHIDPALGDKVVIEYNENTGGMNYYIPYHADEVCVQ